MQRQLLCSNLVVLLLLAVWSGPATAQDNDDCLMCHEDADLTGELGGQERSVYVDPARFTASVHGEFDCVMCHQDLTDELPHADELERVDCGMCHDDQGAEHARSLHGEAASRGDPLAPSCATCHTAHAVKPLADPDSPISVINIPLLCGRCHHEGSPVSLTHDIPQEQIFENYSQSIHGKGLFSRGLTVTAVCTSCHTAHLILPHTDPDSSIHVDNVAGTCTACHAQIERVHRKTIEGRLWEEEPHRIPACIDCHRPHEIRRAFYAAGLADEDCQKCHGDPDLQVTRDGREVSLFVDRLAILGEAHGGTTCAQCHSEVRPSGTRPCETIVSPVDCSVCHAERVADYEESIHGTLQAAGDADAPRCLDCHDRHVTQRRTDPDSPTFKEHVPGLCGRCHQQGKQAETRIASDGPDPVSSYADSIHGKGLFESGLVVTATCADCHTSHRELPPADPRSSVHPDNLADTCGSCHYGVQQVFRTSIHWPENVETDLELPTCESCHTSHSISRTDANLFRGRVMGECGHCHAEAAESFFETFHGKVTRLGGEGAAHCSDCHGTHSILPTDDPRSTLSFRNIVDTCGNCHEGSHREFAGYLTHATHHNRTKYPALFWTFWGMTALLIGTLAFAMLHTLAWLLRLWLTRGQWRRHKLVPGEKLYRRFTRFQRGLHLWMLLSFFTLAITGMALKFSYAAWAQQIAGLLGGFETTGVLHRAGALVLFGVFGLHVIDVVRRKHRERISWLTMIKSENSILFNMRDVREVIASVRWFLGIGPRPRYGRYTYWEKFDYFAVFWGVLVIGSTGLMLWFPELFTRVLPGWMINVATIVHSDEALLAVAFIFTVHFFNTHFRPDKFPMDPVIFTGRVPLDELKQDKPREYEQLVESGELQEHLVEPFPPAAWRWVRGFGFVALAIGLLLIAVILLTMLFGYR